MECLSLPHANGRDRSRTSLDVKVEICASVDCGPCRREVLGIVAANFIFAILICPTSLNISCSNEPSACSSGRVFNSNIQWNGLHHLYHIIEYSLGRVKNHNFLSSPVLFFIPRRASETAYCNGLVAMHGSKSCRSSFLCLYRFRC